MNPNDKTKYASIYNPEAQVLLDYDLSILQAILDIVRHETGSSATKMLLEYEHTLAETYRLGQDRLQREIQERIKGHENETIRRSDD